ncbi:MAG: hypothetical protein NTY90_02345 [Candidatus Micrarchaeota archaeon]|nr:hypothetical protein [Candidatus Micrarchaeota archaeon]
MIFMANTGDATEKDKAKKGAAAPAAKTPKEKLAALKEELEVAPPVEIEVPLKKKRPPLATAPKKHELVPPAPKKTAEEAKPAKPEEKPAAQVLPEAKQVQARAPAAVQKPGEKGVEEELMIRDIIREAEAEALQPGAVVHRRYLIAGKKEGAQPAAARPAAKKAGEETELSQMAQEVYTELKKESLPQPVVQKPVPKRVERREEKKKAAAEEERKITIEELLGEKTEGAGAPGAGAGAGGEAAPQPLFAELEAISGKPAPVGGAKKEAKPWETEKKAGGAKAEEKKEPVCPTCGTKNAKVVFCPYCSTGFCTNCTTSVKPTEEAFYYTCPKCGEEVTVKRK